MSTTSRRLSQSSKHNRNQHTPGKEKGGNCVRPKDYGLAVNGDPTKLKGGALQVYHRLWARYKSANGVKAQ